MARTRHWTFRSLVGAAAGGQAAALGLFPRFFEGLQDISKIAKFSLFGPAVDFTMYEFKQLDSGRSRQYIFTGIGLGFGLGVGADASWNELTGDVAQPFDFNDLDGSTGHVSGASAGYALGGSASSMTVFNTSGRLFTFANMGVVNPAQGAVYVGAQAQTTIGRWWMIGS